MLFTTSEYQKKILQSAIKKAEKNLKQYRMSTIDTLIYSIDKQAELKHNTESKK